LFQDGTGIVGEIAKISLREESVDGLCSQIGKYAEVKSLPDRTGRSIDVTHIDVMQIVEMKTVQRGTRPAHPALPRQGLQPENQRVRKGKSEARLHQ
jgi:hypothetical protein